MKKNIYIYILTGILTQGLVFLMWILLPYFHEPEILGEYNVLLFYIELISTIAVFGGDSVILRYYFSDFNKTEVFGSVFWTFIFTYLGFIFVFFLLFIFFNSLLHIKNIQILILVTLNIFFNSLINLILIHYISIKDSLIYRNLQICKTVLFFSLVFVFSYFSFGIYSFLIANIISILVVSIYHLAKSGVSYFKFPQKLVFNATIRYGAPLAIYSVMGIITLYSSRLFIDKYLTLGLLGIFGFYNVITNQINGLWSSFNKAWTPEVFTKIKNEGSTDFIFESLYFVVFAYLCLLLLGLLAGNFFLFNLLLKKEYLDNINIFIILLFYPLITSIYTILYPLFYFVDRTVLIMKIAIVVAIFSIAITWFFTKKYGLYGAAFSLVLSSFFNLIFYLFCFRKHINLRVTTVTDFLIIFCFIISSFYFLIRHDCFTIFLLLILASLVFVFIKGKLFIFFKAKFLPSSN